MKEFLLFPWRLFWRLVWDLGETTAWKPIVKRAPFIFSQMTGLKGNRLKPKKVAIEAKESEKS
jgi:hypothetical protein